MAVRFDAELRRSGRLGQSADRSGFIAVARDPVRLAVAAVEISVVDVEEIERLRLGLREDPVAVAQHAPHDRNVAQAPQARLRHSASRQPIAGGEGADHGVAASSAVEEGADHPRLRSRDGGTRNSRSVPPNAAVGLVRFHRSTCGAVVSSDPGSLIFSGSSCWPEPRGAARDHDRVVRLARGPNDQLVIVLERRHDDAALMRADRAVPGHGRSATDRLASGVGRPRRASPCGPGREGGPGPRPSRPHSGVPLLPRPLRKSPAWPMKTATRCACTSHRPLDASSRLPKRSGRHPPGQRTRQAEHRQARSSPAADRARRTRRLGDAGPNSASLRASPARQRSAPLFCVGTLSSTVHRKLGGGQQLHKSDVERQILDAAQRRDSEQPGLRRIGRIAALGQQPSVPPLARPGEQSRVRAGQDLPPCKQARKQASLAHSANFTMLALKLSQLRCSTVCRILPGRSKAALDHLGDGFGAMRRGRR